MNKYQQLLTSLCFVLLSASCSSIATNPSLSSELTIDTATIVANNEGASYMLVVRLTPEIPANNKATIEYQKLSNPQQIQVLDLGNLADAQKITFKSKPDNTVHVDHSYRVIIKLYEGGTDGALIAERDVFISANIPSNIAQLMDIRLL